MRGSTRPRSSERKMLLCITLCLLLPDPSSLAQESALWPVKDGCDTMLSTFGEGAVSKDPYAGFVTEFHPGIDIAQPGAPCPPPSSISGGREIRAARPGILEKIWKTDRTRGWVVAIQVTLDGGTRNYDIYAHLGLVSSEITVGDPIEAGETIGTVGDFYTPDDMNHCHFSVLSSFDTTYELYGVFGYSEHFGNALNPLFIFSESRHQDPQQQNPIVGSELNEEDTIYPPILFARAVDEVDSYIFPEKLDDGRLLARDVSGNIDIIVESFDEMNPGYPGHQGVHGIGYWIESLRGGGADVKSANSPYMLCVFNDAWFGNLAEVSRKGDFAYGEYLFDSIFATHGIFEGIPDLDGRPRYHRHVVTNAGDEYGLPQDVEVPGISEQFWRTNAQKDERDGPPNCLDDNCSYGPLKSLPVIAKVNKDARFKDGQYRVHIMSKDLVNTLNYGNAELILNNFPPYVEELQVSSGMEQVYHAWWDFEDTIEQLVWNIQTIDTTPTANKPLTVQIFTSEPMEWVTFELFGHQFDSRASEDAFTIQEGEQGMIWFLSIPPSFFPEEHITPENTLAGEYTPRVRGEDLAGTPLLNFSDADTKTLPNRSHSTQWACSLDPETAPAPVAEPDLRQMRSTSSDVRPEGDEPQISCPMPSGNGDTAHRLNFVATTRSYVQRVKVTSGDSPLYHAGWRPLPAESEEPEGEPTEASGQIAFLFYAEPKDPVPGAPVQVEIHTNEAMESLSARVAGEPDAALEPCEEAETSACWQGALTVPKTEDYQLIFTGQDADGAPVLPFVDTTTKTLSEWMEDSGESGDTVHRLGAFPDPVWALSTPGKSVCSESKRGVTCLFGGDKKGDGQGMVSLHPAKDGTARVTAVLDGQDEPGSVHSGEVWGSPSGLVLEIQPPLDALDLCKDQAGGSIEKRCPHSWDYDPKLDAPPGPEDRETQLTWKLKPAKKEGMCELQVSWGAAGGSGQQVTLAIEPASLCDAFIGEQHTIPVTGVCAWLFEGGDYDWEMEELPPENFGPCSSPLVRQYIDCRDYQPLRFGGSVSRGCRINPWWESPPSWTKDEILPGEPRFRREQTISVTYSGCQEWDDRVSKSDRRYSWPFNMVDLEDGDDWVYQLKGQFHSGCMVEVKKILWKPIGDCKYRYKPEPQSIQFPEGAISIPLSGNR